MLGQELDKVNTLLTVFSLHEVEKQRASSCITLEPKGLLNFSGTKEDLI